MKIFKVVTFFLLLFGIFILTQSLDIAFDDSQCKRGGCSGQVCYSDFLKISTGAPITHCMWNPEYGCLKGCAVRGFQCGFDPEHKANCIDCINECKSAIERKSLAGHISFENCTQSCY